jgi:alpha-galactosidase
MNKTLLLFLCSILFFTTNGNDNGLGITPPMGWNSWNHFACNINEELIKKTADRIVQLGLDKKGYTYVNLDDCWQISRDNATGEII